MCAEMEEIRGVSCVPNGTAGSFPLWLYDDWIMQLDRQFTNFVESLGHEGLRNRNTDAGGQICDVGFIRGAFNLPRIGDFQSYVGKKLTLVTRQREGSGIADGDQQVKMILRYCLVCGGNEGVHVLRLEREHVLAVATGAGKRGTGTRQDADVGAAFAEMPHQTKGVFVMLISDENGQAGEISGNGDAVRTMQHRG